MTAHEQLKQNSSDPLGLSDLETIEPGTPLCFDGIEVHAFLTPHRGEDTDTIGLEFEGPTRRLLYVSDADVFPPELARRIREADVALIDGTFYDRDELPNREILATNSKQLMPSSDWYVL